MISIFLRMYEHLLPRAHAWSLKRIDSQVREFFEGLTGLPADVKAFFDARWDDIDPQRTTQLDAWEEQWGLPDTNLTEQQRRDRLEAAWSTLGGQSPRYLQDTIQANGFDVWIHEAFVDPPQVPPIAPVIRNPLLYLSDGGPEFLTVCAAPTAVCGNVNAICGATGGPTGILLVNVIEDSVVTYIACGDPEMVCGGALAYCGAFTGVAQIPKTYPVPTDPALWPFVLYYGGETFPDSATVPGSRRAEFETLLLRISPGQQWLGLLVNYS